MIVITYNQSIITAIYSVDKKELHRIPLGDQEYKVFENTNANVGMDIRSINDLGMVKSIPEMLEIGLITLEDNQVLVGEEIITLDEDEVFENGVVTKIPQKMTRDTHVPSLDELLSVKQYELTDLRNQYVDADLNDNEELKILLKDQFQILQDEITALTEQINDEAN